MHTTLPLDAAAQERDLGQGEVETRPSIKRMRSLYDLEAGRLRCRCLIRKWKFCGRIRDLAGGRMAQMLLKCPGVEKRREIQGRDRKWGVRREGTVGVTNVGGNV